MSERNGGSRIVAWRIVGDLDGAQFVLCTFSDWPSICAAWRSRDEAVDWSVEACFESPGVSASNPVREWRPVGIRPSD
jgi:hypothetical protein